MIESPFLYEYVDANSKHVSMEIDHNGTLTDLMTKIDEQDVNVNSAEDFIALTGINLWKFPYEAIDDYLDREYDKAVSDLPALASLLKQMDDRYMGRYDSMADFVKEHYLYHGDDIPEALENHIDWESFAKEYSGYVGLEEACDVYVFISDN